MVKPIAPMFLTQIENEAKRINEINMSLVETLEQEYDLEGLVFMDMAQEDELPLDNMTYFIIENGDYSNNQSEQKFFTENVSITFWNENRPNPTLDRLKLLLIAKQHGLKVQSSDNQNIILTKTNRVVNMFTLTCTRGIKVQGAC